MYEFVADVCSESDARLKLEIQLRQLRAELNEKNEQLSQVSLNVSIVAFHSSLVPILLAFFSKCRYFRWHLCLELCYI